MAIPDGFALVRKEWLPIISEIDRRAAKQDGRNCDFTVVVTADEYRAADDADRSVVPDDSLPSSNDEEIDALTARVAELEARIAELQPMAECAAIMAVCGYFSRMRGPVLWQYRSTKYDSHNLQRDYEMRHVCGEARANELAGYGCEIRPLYAGSAPVPAAQSDGCDEALLDTMRELVDAEENLTEMTERKDAAYFERNQVVAALAKCFPSIVTQTDIPGWSHDWHGCVYIQLPTGQVSWHFHESQMYLLDGIPTKGAGWDGWDGHGTDEKYRRVNALSIQTAHNSAGAALSALSKAMQDDADLAWSWHCNIAMTAQDAGAPHDRANIMAADFMRRAFDVDTLSRANAMPAAKAKGGGA